MIVTIGLAVSSARAEWTSFLPRPFENALYLDLFASHERDDNQSGARSYDWNDTFLREKLTLESNGYVYHPRFLQYQLSLSGGLKQENYWSTYVSTEGFRRGSGFEYDVKLAFLPEHPYNLQLFARRYEPLYKEQAAVRHNSVETTHGGFFRYRKKPWFLHASYTNDSLVSSFSSTNVKRVGVDGQYFKRYRGGNELSLTAAWTPSWFSNSLGVDGNSVDYSLGGFLNLRRVRLNTSVTKNTFEQQSRSPGTLRSDLASVYQLVTVYLPLNFTTDLTFRGQKNDSTIPGGSLSPDRQLSETTRDLQFDVTQRLYQSLDWTYMILDHSRSSESGETTGQAQSLTVGYGKTIPRGRVLIGLNGARSTTDSRGQTDIVDERHPGIVVPGSFLLGQPDVAPGSIVVFLKSPLAPNENIRLVEGIHYTSTLIANTIEIHVLTLPPQFVVPGSYEFFVSYSLKSGDFRLGSDSFGYNARVELLDNFLTPYFNYLAVRSDVLSGDFPGIPLNSTTYTAGLAVLRGPVRSLVEYQDLEWDVSPYRAWRTEVQYIGPISPTSNVYGTLAYLNKYFPEGTSTQNTEAYDEETTSVSGSLQKQLRPRGLALSAGGSFSWFKGRTDSKAYSVNGSLMWKVGKIDFTAGATAYKAETHGMNTVSTDRLHQYYYFTLRRQLF